MKVDACFGKTDSCIICGESFATTSSIRNKCHKCSPAGAVVVSAWERLIADIKNDNQDVKEFLLHILHQECCPAYFYFDDYYTCERRTSDYRCKKCWLYEGDINAQDNQD